jgi:hypothetical protein
LKQRVAAVTPALTPVAKEIEGRPGAAGTRIQCGAAQFLAEVRKARAR